MNIILNSYCNLTCNYCFADEYMEDTVKTPGKSMEYDYFQNEFLPKIKELKGVVVNRNVCGGCLDFKLGVTVPLEEFGAWEEAGHPPESDFLEKLRAIPGVS